MSSDTQPVDVLSFELEEGGFHPDVFGYKGDGVCPMRKIPGSSDGASLFVLNDWKSVVQALKNSKIRSLRHVPEDNAVGGVTLQHQDGLLRRDPPQTDLRRTINPFFSATATEPWRIDIRNCARKYAQRIGDIDGTFDLAEEFCKPFIAEVISVVTGLRDGEWETFSNLSDRTTGTLVASPDDHEVIKQAWRELYEFCGELVARIRSDRRVGVAARSITSQVVNALDDLGLDDDEILRACTTVYNGFPTVVPAVNVAAQQLLLHQDVIAEHKEDPQLWPKLVKELLRHRAHFSFGLPGRVSEDTQINDTFIPAGSTVLPAIHAAEHDPNRTKNPREFDITRDSASLVAFGMGVHVCPGKAFSLLLLEEGLRELIETNPEMRLASEPSDIEWQMGTMPSPKTIPVVIQRQSVSGDAL